MIWRSLAGKGIMNLSTPQSQKSSTTNKKSTATLNDERLTRLALHGVNQEALELTGPMPTPESTEEEFDRCLADLKRIYDEVSKWTERWSFAGDVLAGEGQIIEKERAAIATLRETGLGLDDDGMRIHQRGVRSYKRDVAIHARAEELITAERERWNGLMGSWSAAFGDKFGKTHEG